MADHASAPVPIASAAVSAPRVSVGSGIVLALDYGLVRTGLAVGNLITHTGRPLKTLQALNRTVLLEQLAPLIKEWQPQTLVLGLPTHPDGAEHEMTRATRNLAGKLRRFGVPVVLVDERYSSVEGGHDDAQAAAVILERYFAQLLNSEVPAPPATPADTASPSHPDAT
jgi:putative Holliday junction resolvase